MSVVGLGIALVFVSFLVLVWKIVKLLIPGF